MEIERPKKARSKIADSGGRIEIIIPSGKNIFALLFMSFWLCGWIFGFVSVTYKLFVDAGSKPDAVFMVLWLVGWTAGGFLAVIFLLWGLIGKVVISVNITTLVIARKIGSLTLKKGYSLNSCSNFRVNPVSPMTRGMEFFEFLGKSDGTLAFDYGMKTVKFGAGIDEAEAAYIIKLLQDRGFTKKQ